MVTVGEIYRLLDEIAPFDSALEYDNPGLLVGDSQQPVTTVLLALDITAAVVQEAAELDAQLILSHHPVIFHPMKRLLVNSAPYLLAKHGISAICAHTNLDMAPEWGVNAALADVLQLCNLTALTRHGEHAETLIGTAREREPRHFAEFVKQQLCRPVVEYCEGNTRVHRVALCSGAGGEFIANAIDAGADAFVTGEVKHHEWLAACESGLTVVCAGHFGTENIVLERLQQLLQDRLPELKLQKSLRCQDPICWL